MSILTDNDINLLCSNQDKPMIEPFIDKQIKCNDNNERLISYGLSSHGYDIRIADEFKIFTNINSALVDPKEFNDASFVYHQGPFVIIPPNSFILARSLEYFNIPDDVCGIVLGKSTYARAGVSCICTPMECGWHGELVLEFANNTPLPVKMYANEGAAQVVFFKSDVRPNITYADRDGKYLGQTGITTSKV